MVNWKGAPDLLPRPVTEAEQMVLSQHLLKFPRLAEQLRSKEARPFQDVEDHFRWTGVRKSSLSLCAPHLQGARKRSQVRVVRQKDACSIVGVDDDDQ